MKLKHVTSPTIHSEEIKKSVMGMSVQGLELASWVMRDKIYTDKPLAVIREYICNAVDEHRKYKVERPVEVRLKNENGTYMWSCRDFAKGLDDHGVRFIFGQYFESTKNGSNEGIGGFGVGSKAGHSYTDTFYITSHFEGTKTQYACVLGAGKNGIPIGEIFELHSEPTTETGIEISLEVKNASEFHTKTTRIVQSFSNDVSMIFYSDYDGANSSPLEPIQSETFGKIKVSLYDHHPHASSTQYAIRMGGIVYDIIYLMNGNERSTKAIVVDVPIGSMDLPITRESFEDTENNRKMKDTIKSVLDGIRKREEDSFPKPTIRGILKEGIGDYFNTKKDGMYFQHSLSKIFADEYLIITRMTFREKDAVTDTSKHKVYVFPDIKNTSTWEYRLAKHLGEDETRPSYNRISESYMNYVEQGLVDTTGLEFIRVKKMGLAKIKRPTDEKGKRQYAIYINNSNHNTRYYSSIELEERAVNNVGKLEKDWAQKAQSIDELLERTIACRKTTTFPRWNSPKYVCNSEKLVEEMLALGWLEYEGDAYREEAKRIHEKEQEDRKKEYAVEHLYRDYLGCINYSKYLIRAIKAKPERIVILKNKVSEIAGRNNTIGRWMKFYRREKRTWGNEDVITRQDIRSILTSIKH